MLSFRAAGCIYALFAATTTAYFLSVPSRRPPLVELGKILLLIAGVIPFLFLVPLMYLCLRCCCRCCGGGGGAGEKKKLSSGAMVVSSVLGFVVVGWGFLWLNGGVFYYIDDDWRNAALFNFASTLAVGVISLVSFRPSSVHVEEPDEEPHTSTCSSEIDEVFGLWSSLTIVLLFF